MKILVIGGAGYVGSVLVPELKRIGHDVTVIDLLWFGNRLPLDINVIKRDAFELTVDELKEYEQIIFLAGLSNDPMAEFSPKQNFIQNASLPSYLTYLAKAANVKRFIFASSCSIYGNASEKKFRETDHVFSKYPYGIAKIQAEFVIQNLADENFSTICLRKGTISGYSPRMRFDLVINSMVRSILLNNKIVINNPNIWRPILSMQDAIMTYVKAIEAPYEISGIFNIASDNYQLSEIGIIIKDTLEKNGYQNIDIETKNIYDNRNYRVNCTYGKHMLDLEYKYKIKEIVENLLLNKENFKDLNNKNYFNIEIFKTIM